MTVQLHSYKRNQKGDTTQIMSKPKEGHKNEFVTMSILKDMMELQDKAYKFTVKTFTDEIKAKIKEIRKEVEDLKLSVKFVSASHDDFKTQLGKIDDEMDLPPNQLVGLSLSNFSRGKSKRTS